MSLVAINGLGDVAEHVILTSFCATHQRGAEGARPQPRSNRMPAADTRAAGATASWMTIPRRSTLLYAELSVPTRALPVLVTDPVAASLPAQRYTACGHSGLISTPLKSCDGIIATDA